MQKGKSNQIYLQTFSVNQNCKAIPNLHHKLPEIIMYFGVDVKLFVFLFICIPFRLEKPEINGKAYANNQRGSFF